MEDRAKGPAHPKMPHTAAQKLGTMMTDMKKAATLAACPPLLRASKPVSLMCSDSRIMLLQVDIRQALIVHDRPRPHACAIRLRMSSTRQTVTRGPSFTACGKRPSLTPAHQQDFLTGIIAGIGGSASGLPMICGRRRKPVSGSVLAMFYLFRPMLDVLNMVALYYRLRRARKRVMVPCLVPYSVSSMASGLMSMAIAFALREGPSDCPFHPSASSISMAMLTCFGSRFGS